jgi:BlaI family penicillinase repressor
MGNAQFCGASRGRLRPTAPLAVLCPTRNNLVNEPALSKRERQIMDVIFRLGEASAADVHERLPEAPSYTAVRTMLRLLEDKGMVVHRQDGRSALHRVLNVFFGGSLEDAIAAHLSDPGMHLDAADLKRLRAVIDDAEETKKETIPKKSPKASRSTKGR